MAPPIRQVGAGRAIKLLVFADSGAGKTTFLGTGGEGVLIIRPPIDHTESIIGSGAQEWIVHDWEEMEEAKEYCQHEGKKHNWVCLDSISSWQDQGLDDIWREVVDRRPDRKGGPIDQGEYGRNMVRLAQWVRDMVGAAEDNPFNLVITAWPALLWDEQLQDDKLKPWIQGKMMSDRIMGYMNMVGYLQVKKGKRIMRFGTTEEYAAKDQFNAFLPNHRLISPTLPKLEQAVKQVRAKQKPTRTVRKDKNASKKRNAQ